MTTTISTKLTQVHQYVWYGTCESELCDDELFEEWGSKFSTVKENVVEISTYEEGILKTYRPSGIYPTTNPGVGELDRFKCGYMYSITLTKNGQIEMDNMYPSNSNSIDAKYGVSSTCSALGEIGLSCIPEGFTSFSYIDAVQLDEDEQFGVLSEIILAFKEVDGVREICNIADGETGCKLYGSFQWNEGGKRDPNSYFSIDASKLDPKIDENDSPVISFNLKVGKETDANPRLVGYLNLQTRPSEDTEVHFYENATCYKGTLPSTEADQTIQEQGEEDIFLEEIWSSSSMCTFQDTEDSDGEPIVYQSFDVGPDFDDVTTGDIRPMGFVVQGELRVPPAGESAEGDFTLYFRFVNDGVIDEDFGEVGRVVYHNCIPKTKEGVSLGVYMFVKSGYLTGKCLFGNIAGETCYLGE